MTLPSTEFDMHLELNASSWIDQNLNKAVSIDMNSINYLTLEATSTFFLPPKQRTAFTIFSSSQPQGTSINISVFLHHKTLFRSTLKVHR